MNRILLPCLLSLVDCLSAAEVPYGHADFYPTPERPLGFLADGNGHYPAGVLPKAVDVDAKTGVVWTAELPNGMAQPLVIGERLIVTADPNLVICLSVHDGTEQWRLTLDPARDMPMPLATGLASEQAYYERCIAAYADWRERALALSSRRDQAKLHHKKYPVTIERGKRVDLPIDDQQFQTDLKRLRDDQEACGWALHQSDNSDMIDKGFWQAWRSKVHRLYGLTTFNNWYGFLTHSFQTPVTDGEFIYAVGTQGQVACLDVFGRLYWLRYLPHDHLADPRMHTRFTRSPVLYGNYLVVRGSGYLRVLNRHDGQVLWTKVFIAELRPRPEATPMRVMAVPDASGARVPIVIDSGGLVYRLDDGSKLHEFPIPETTWESRWVVKDDILITPRKGAVTAYRLRLDATKLHVEQLWEEAGKDAWAGIRYGDQVVMQNGKGDPVLADIVTGRHTAFPAKSIKQQYGFTHIVGDRLVSWDDPMKRGAGRATIFSLPSGGRESWNIADLRFKKDAGFFKAWGHRGSNFFTMTNSAPIIQGSRSYWRTTGMARCFADAKGPAPVAKSWPKQGLVRTAAPDRPRPEEALAGLVHELAAIRQAVLADIAAGKAVISPSDLMSAYRQQQGAKRLDILRAMAAKPEGLAAMAPELVNDLLAGDRGLALNAGWALARLGPAATPAVKPLLDWLSREATAKYPGKHDAPPTQRTLAVCLALLGSGHNAAVMAAAQQKGKHAWAMSDAEQVLAGTHADPSKRPMADPKPTD